jgi:hypothetical protein
MPKGFDLRCAAGKTARVWKQGQGGGLKPGQAFVLLPKKEGEGPDAAAGYLSPPRQALIDRNHGQVNVEGITIAEGIDDCSDCIGIQSQTNHLPGQRITLRTFLLIDLPDQSSL